MIIEGSKQPTCKNILVICNTKGGNRLFVLNSTFYNYIDMAIMFDSNQVLSKKERQERVLDLHFNQNKNYRQIAQEMKISPRDIGQIVNRAMEEKERQEHKSLSVQAYDKFSKGKTPLQVAIDLNIGQAQTTQYYSEYLKLVGLEDITKLYNIEFKGDVSYFVSLCRAARAARMGIPQVINLLRIANDYLPSALYPLLESIKSVFALKSFCCHLQVLVSPKS